MVIGKARLIHFYNVFKISHNKLPVKARYNKLLVKISHKINIIHKIYRIQWNKVKLIQVN